MESEESIVDLSRLCRTCKTARSKMSPLFARYDDSGSGLDDMLMWCTSLKVMEGDGFPDSICNSCVRKLKTAYQFKQQCEIADQYYKQLNRLRELESRKLIHLKNGVKEIITIEKEVNQDKDPVQLKEELESDGEGNLEVFKNSVEIKEEKEVSFTIEDPVIYMEGDNEEKDNLQLKKEENLIHNINLEKSDASEEIHRLRKKAKSSKNNQSEIVQCTKCGQNFDNAIALETHSSFHTCQVYIPRLTHSDDPKQHGTPRKHTKEHLKCDICDKSFSTKTHLRRHKLTHNSSRRYECDVCDKSYTREDTLRTHQLKHDRTKSFTCEVCGKTLASKQGLRVHELAHDKRKRRFKCDICKNSYFTADTLRKHKFTHDDKRFECDVCGKGFTYGWNMRAHKRVHGKRAELKGNARSEEFSN